MLEVFTVEYGKTFSVLLSQNVIVHTIETATTAKPDGRGRVGVTLEDVEYTDTELISGNDNISRL